jgi:hypothetical protein
MMLVMVVIMAAMNSAARKNQNVAVKVTGGTMVKSGCKWGVSDGDEESVI